jgi:FixJ family two-component response regulator
MTDLREPVVYVVDDDNAVRAALCALLTSVHLRADAYESAEAFLKAVHPDMHGCLILDVRMPGMGGLELQRVLTERGVTLPVIMITGHGDVPLAVRAMKAGAVDFIEKPFHEQELLDRIQASLAADVETRRRVGERRGAAQRLGQLTRREAEVLELLAQGRSTKGVASTLGISERTVDVHRFNIMRKTGARNLLELARLKGLATEKTRA